MPSEILAVLLTGSLQASTPMSFVLPPELSKAFEAAATPIVTVERCVDRRPSPGFEKVIEAREERYSAAKDLVEQSWGVEVRAAPAIERHGFSCQPNRLGALLKQARNSGDTCLNSEGSISLASTQLCHGGPITTRGNRAGPLPPESPVRPAFLACLAPALIATSAVAQETTLDPRTAIYELRIYYPAPGKLAALNTRFREHTLTIFAKHGMKSVAYWNEQPSPEAPEGRVVYILAYPSRAAHDESWKAFRSDPEWQAAAAASEANGKLVTKVDSIFMTMADYSPALTLPR